MAKKRMVRLNSLLKEVISDVIRKDVRNPHINELLTVTNVEITSDLHYAKVYVSVIAPEEEKQKTVDALQSAAGFIAVNASKQVVMRYFPQLFFKLDDSVDQRLRIEKLLADIDTEQKSRPHHPEDINDDASESSH